jgi:hypothetical protein
VRTDQPSTADDLADREALPERTSDRLELEQRLGLLPPGHPSSPVEADGTPRPPEPGLRRYELTEAHPPADTDKRPLTDAEHVKEVCALPDKARADIDLSVPDEEASERLDEEQVPQPDQKLAAGAGQELAAREGRERRYEAQERPDWEVSERERAVDAVCARFEITDPEKRRAVGDVYQVTRENTAPFVVKVTDDMLVDLHAEAERNPNLTVAFLGRDGHSLAITARRLDPGFYADHCREVVLSRSVVEAAVQDLEANAGKTFPEIADFRAAGRKVDPETVDGARQRLTEYLQTCGIPVGDPDSEVALVDTSYKGTVQELLTATYPKTSFQGRYAFFGASPHDTHADTKKGYALHLDAGHSEGGRPVSELPADERLTLSHQDAIGAIEETLHGPWTSRDGSDRPGDQSNSCRGTSQTSLTG